MPTISDRIAASSERLTPTERRIAQAVLDDPTLLAFGSVSDLAALIGTSRPTIVRFATKLGFGGYADLQDQVRSGFSQELLRPSQRIRKPAPAKDQAALEGALHSVLHAATEEKLNSLAAPIAQATRVWILSGETSRAGAAALHSGLAMVRPGVSLIDSHSSGSILSSAGPEDAAIVIDFARYRRHCIATAQVLAADGVNLIAITDGPLSPLAALTPLWCELKVPAVGPFDSSVPCVAFAELLVAHVAHQMHAAARERIDRTEALWDATGTFL